MGPKHNFKDQPFQNIFAIFLKEFHLQTTIDSNLLSIRHRVKTSKGFYVDDHVLFLAFFEIIYMTIAQNFSMILVWARITITILILAELYSGKRKIRKGHARYTGHCAGCFANMILLHLIFNNPVKWVPYLFYTRNKIFWATFLPI